MRQYKMVKEVDLGDDGPQAGEIWQAFGLCDYGLKSDHERITGEEHVNLSRDGDYPFFTVPMSAVEAVS